MANDNIINYINLLLFMVSTSIIILILIITTFIVSTKRYDRIKVSMYECGFEPFDDTTQHTFNINFYNVGLLFLLFDIELIILLPGLMSFSILTSIGRCWMVLFMFILIIGFIYEFNKNILVIHTSIRNPHNIFAFTNKN